MDIEEKRTVLQEFHACVNMTPTELENWLCSDQSRITSVHNAGSLSDHRAGWWVLEITRKDDHKLDESDYDQMMRTVGFIKRQASEEPYGYINGSQWRFTLMNWGHDPLKS